MLFIKEEIEPKFTFDIIANVHLTSATVSFKEDWHFDDEEFSLPVKAPFGVLADVTKQINNKIDQYVLPVLYSCLSENNYHIELDRHGKEYSSGKIVKVPKQDVLSYACYFNIAPNEFNINCSDVIYQSISTFRLRLANHISSAEIESINNSNNVKLFIENINGLYAQKFKNCTNNVLTAYTEFINKLSIYDTYIDNFTDIKLEDINKLKQFTLQGF